MEARSYKSRTREEVMAWLQRARERKDAFALAAPKLGRLQEKPYIDARVPANLNKV